MSRFGIVVVGRNEGERLHTSIRSVQQSGAPVVYVDSGSHDGSASWAREAGATVIELDTTKPMSAARARNAGFERLLNDHSELEFVQFVDGDCEVFPEWFERGVAALASRDDVGIVCGRVMERHPEASIYNRMCNIEWQKEPGEIAACGGIFMVRAKIFLQLKGFRVDVMAAEDDELCLRTRRLGLKIVALSDRMVLHDAAITKFSQWWTRARRTGMAYAQGAALHGASPDRHFQRDCQRVWFWALGVPVASIAMAIPTRGVSLLGFLGYPVLATRIYRGGRANGLAPTDAGLLAVFNVLAKLPELAGIIHYHHRTRWLKRQVELIEYKGLKHS